MSRTSALTHTFALLLRRLGAAFFCAAILTVCAWAQDTAAVPHLVQFNGTVADTPQGKTGAVFALYKDQTDRMPLWQETQSLDVDAGGRYIVQLGAGSPEGIPVEVFGDGQAHWLGVQIDGRAEQPRILLTSVPYAMKASDAETLGGLPASAFLRTRVGNVTTPPVSNTGAPAGNSTTAKAVRPSLTATGAAAGYLAAFTDASGDLGKALIFETPKFVGIGTATPAYPLSVSGIIQSSTGGFKFPDGTTQTTALALPATWKYAANASGVVNATNTSNGPTASQSTSLAALPAGIEGISSGSGITAGVQGKVTSTSSGAFGLGVMGMVPSGSHGTAVLAYSQDGNDPVVEAVDTSTSGTHTLYNGEAYSPAFNGLSFNFHTPTVTGTIINASANNTLLFQVGGGGDIWSNGGLTVSGNAAIKGNLTVSGTINGKSADSQLASPRLSAPGAKTGYLPVFTDTTGDLGDSLIFQTPKYVGIGTAAPAYPLSVAGVIQSSTGGFRFPDGTTQTSAVTLPVNWTGVAKAPAGVLNVTSTSTGPPVSKGQTLNFRTVPSAIVGTASGTGTVAGVTGTATSRNDTTGIAVGVLGEASNAQSVAVMGYSANTGFPTIMAVNTATSGSMKGVAIDMSSPAATGLGITFAVPTTGNMIDVGVGMSQNPNPYFRVDGNGSISTSGGLSLGNGITLKNGLTINGWPAVQMIKAGSSGGSFVVDGIGDISTTNRLSVGGSATIDGDLNVKGNISKSSGTFKIDHPLDPANKYLSHSFVESPDMMNIYNGNVTTDSHGLAVVELPGYFEALNQDFRYQLTVIGQFAQAIVAEEIANNRFTIRTDKPAVKVSWQVTGIRHDAYADAHRVVVEEEKLGTERGTYLHPELVVQKP